jgi:hypothetical protein
MMLYLVSVILGSSWMIRLPAPGSVAQAQPVWVLRLWAVMTLVSGVIGLAGVIWAHVNLQRGLLLQVSALLFAGANMTLYGTSMIGVGGMRSFGSFMIFSIWSVANVWRTKQIRDDLRELKDPWTGRTGSSGSDRSSPPS